MTNQTPFIKQLLFDFSHLARDPWSMNLGSGAPGENRTPTPVKERDFESRASTSSATGAYRSAYYCCILLGQQ
jgi:hypothetical protein